MQGCKNTHNRFGSIDFVALKEQILNELEIGVDIDSTKTVKGISKQLGQENKIESFYAMIREKTDIQFKVWFEKISTKTVILR
jgi:cobalt-precorrin-5B (C1)-methyltransferase